MRLTKEQETQATEKLIEMLDGAYRCLAHAECLQENQGEASDKERK